MPRSMLKTISLSALAFGIIVLCALVCLKVGRYPIALEDILTLFVGTQSHIESNPTYAMILLEFRLPRVLLALFVGAGLSISGCAFQNLFRNPLASPDILGVTAGASFGAVLALLLGLGVLWVSFFGFLSGLIALLLVVAVSYDKMMPYNTLTMILSGIIIAALFQSLVSLIKYLADPQDTLPTITYWLLGSLDSTFSLQMWLGIAGISLGSVVLFCLRWKLNILTLDDDEAKSLGVNLNALRLVVVLASTLIVACAVGLCGIIGWIGLLIPHIARLFVGNENARLVPLSLFIGALFLMIVDTFSRTISHEQIPISILTALIGAPFFIYILYKNKGLRL